MQELGKNIRLLRRQRGWSQGDFAERVGLSVPAFSKIENGITDINLSRLEQIAKVLDMSLIDFLSLEPSFRSEKDSALAIANDTIKSNLSQILYLQQQVIILHEEIRKVTQNVKHEA